MFDLAPRCGALAGYINRVESLGHDSLGACGLGQLSQFCAFSGTRHVVGHQPGSTRFHQRRQQLPPLFVGQTHRLVSVHAEHVEDHKRDRLRALLQPLEPGATMFIEARHLTIEHSAAGVDVLRQFTERRPLCGNVDKVRALE